MYQPEVIVRNKRSLQERVHHALVRDWQLWVLVLPACAIIFIFAYIPMYGVRLAFHEYSFAEGLMGGEYVGIKYFEQFFFQPDRLENHKEYFYNCNHFYCSRVPGADIFGIVI